jgi:hypothetical protein
MVVDHVYVAGPPPIVCQVPSRRVWTEVEGGPPVTVTMKLNVVAVVPLVGDTDPVKTVVPQVNAATRPGATNRPRSTTLMARVAMP